MQEYDHFSVLMISSPACSGQCSGHCVPHYPPLQVVTSVPACWGEVEGVIGNMGITARPWEPALIAAGGG